MQTRRDFLRTTVLGIAGLAAAGCSSEKQEWLYSDLANLVNEMGMEGTKRKNIQDKSYKKSPYQSPFPPAIVFYVESDWRSIALEMILDETRNPEQYPLNNLYSMDQIDNFRQQRSDQIKSINGQGPLAIAKIQIRDGKLTESSRARGIGVWGGTSADELNIQVQDGSKYNDTLKFLAVNRPTESATNDDESYSKNARVTLASKKQNIASIQAAYGISEAEATQRLNQWLPKVLATAHKLYVPPSSFPDESWLPNKNLLIRSPREYTYRTVQHK